MKERLAKVSQLIAQSYKKDGSVIEHLDLVDLPSREGIIRIIENFLEVIYPGYYGKHGLVSQTVTHHVYEKTEELFKDLKAQIYLAIRHSCAKVIGAGGTPECLAGLPLPNNECSVCQAKSEEWALSMLEKVPFLREMLNLDVQAAYQGDPAAKDYHEIIFSYPGLLAVTIYRIAHELHLLAVKLIPRIMTEYAHSVTGLDIHPGATIGKSFFIDHGTGVVIGETTIIGDNVRLYHGVTLGAMSFPRDSEGKLIRGLKRHPTVEDDVIIYSGSTILGGVTVIGKGSIVGGNVWLTHSVPPYSKVISESPNLKIHCKQMPCKDIVKED